MESEKLMPCAHCGGRAKVFTAYDSMHCVQCTVCGITTLYSHDENDAIKSWNRRNANEHE